MSNDNICHFLDLLLVNIIAILITGGGSNLKSAELYLPPLRSSCILPSLPDDRVFHSVDNDILCGGGQYTTDSCLQWTPSSGSWVELLTLDIERMQHVTWTPGSGIGTYLIGGYCNRSTTTLINPDGTQERGFTLEYDIR